MYVIGHDNGCMQIETVTVLFQATCENNVSGWRGKDPAMIRGEGDEERVIVLLIVGKTTAILILRQHRASALRAERPGRKPGPTNQNHKFKFSNAITQSPNHR